jgi:hypothetical protein
VIEFLRLKVHCEAGARSNLVNDFGMQFALVSREETLRQLNANLSKHLNNPCEDRKGHVIPAFAGCTGIGKTRLLDEIPEQLKQIRPNSRVISLLVTYGNGKTMMPGIDDRYPAQAFCWRMLHYYLGAKLSLSSFMDLLRASRWDWTSIKLHHVLEYIVHEESRIAAGQGEFCVYIGLDEFQALLVPSPDIGVTCLSKVVVQACDCWYYCIAVRTTGITIWLSARTDFDAFSWF